MIDAMAVIERIARAADHRERHAGIGLALEMRMSDAVAGAVKRDPDILGAAIGLAEAVDDGLGNAAVARERFGIAAEADDLARRAGAILEDEARDEQMLSADAQIRLAGKEHLAHGLRSESDRDRKSTRLNSSQ